MENHHERFCKIREEWKKFISGAPADQIDSTIVSKAILQSWERSREYGIDPYLKKISIVLNGPELDMLLGKNAELIRTSEPFIEQLYQCMKGSRFVCTLCDHEGYILKIVGDEDIINRVREGNFIVGALTSENSIGPNGIGAVLIQDKPIQLFATEHYCISFHKYTCSGAPIHDHEGNIIGVLNMTGPYLEANPHTLGMVVAAAHAIENLLHLKAAFNECQIAESFQKTVISSIPEALIVVDQKGDINLINKNAQKMLGLDPRVALGKHIRDVMGSNNESFLNKVCHNKCLTDEEVRIYNDDGEFSDYTLTFNLILTPLKHIIGKIIILNEIKRARTLVTKMTGAKAKITFNDITGQNSDFQETIRLARIASQSTSNVLLLGESGTGKDVFAQAIHNNSERRNGPYVVINCAAIPRELIASELFGYDEGAFTGSKRGGNPGKFEIADGGTIFLDEIGEMPLELQTSLLRVIENKELMRIGGKRVRSINVRILAATNKDLVEDVSKGNFREDLYYRLNVFTIRLHPLRERRDDIPYLVDRFVKDICATMAKKITAVDDNVLQILMSYSWPGNVRELQNVLERAINIAPG
ncbi:MAG TPA: sigma-54-dependent Fis family transcriptional regulator, partial [Deltaproteobacteria bacterium]|nr:sigma-54-dependent Fis family transcriptional regulator [Deltaproteobacteria bacterium]